MVSIEYSQSAVEVLEILEHTKKEYVDKIPRAFIEFLKKNSSKTYNSKLDYTKPISDLKLKPKTEALLGLIYMKYWAEGKDKEEFEKRIKDNEKKYQENIRAKYNPDNLFKKI